MLFLFALVLALNIYLNYHHRKQVEVIHAAILLAITAAQKELAISILAADIHPTGEDEDTPDHIRYYYETDAGKMH